MSMRLAVSFHSRVPSPHPTSPSSVESLTKRKFRHAVPVSKTSRLVIFIAASSRMFLNRRSAPWSCKPIYPDRAVFVSESEFVPGPIQPEIWLGESIPIDMVHVVTVEHDIDDPPVASSAERSPRHNPDPYTRARPELPAQGESGT